MSGRPPADPSGDGEQRPADARLTRLLTPQLPIHPGTVCGALTPSCDKPTSHAIGTNMHGQSAIGQTGARCLMQASIGEAMSTRAERDDQRPASYTVPAVRQVRRGAVHTAHISAIPSGEAVHQSPPEREVCDLWTLLLRRTERVTRRRRSGLIPDRWTQRDRPARRPTGSVKGS